MINIKDLKPAYNIHPGEHLQDEMTARHITLSKMVRLSNLPRHDLVQLLQGKKNIDKGIATCIGNAFKMDPQPWINLQVLYDMLKKNS